MKKTIFVISTVLSLIFLPCGLALAGHGIQYDRVVVGTGSYPADLNNVQAAVSQGGNILLKGTFDFMENRGFPSPNPPPQWVIISKDVGIYGETDNHGTPLTLIKGGFWSFLSPLPSPLPITKPGPRITIQGIHFDGALWAPINIAYTSGATITGNKITNCIPFGPGLFDPVNYPYMFSLNAGIIVGPWFVQSGPARLYREGAVTGQLTITDNKIDLENNDPGNNLGQGIFVNWGTGITAKIAGNTIIGVSRNSIEVLDNHQVNGKGSVVIEGNDIVTSEVGIPYPGTATPNGIVFGWWLDTLGYDPANNGQHQVMHNSIRIKGETSVGIMALADEALVLNNHIVSEGPKATGLGVMGSNCVVAHNKIEGVGDYALNVSPAALNALIMGADYNLFQGNNYNLFDAYMFDVRFAPGADHNVLVGHSGSVSDLGSDNRITNFNFRGKGLKLGAGDYYLPVRRGR